MPQVEALPNFIAFKTKSNTNINSIENFLKYFIKKFKNF
jgi:hypothetical protein